MQWLTQVSQGILSTIVGNSQVGHLDGNLPTSVFVSLVFFSFWEWNISRTKHNNLKKFPTGRRQISWLFTSITEELDLTVYKKTTPA